jgi:hypothetical protein
MLPVKATLPPAKRRLLALYDALDERDRATLTALAEFLAARQAGGVEPLSAVPEPDWIPRPAEESVIAAIRRLSRTYHMLDKALMLHDTSALMSAHILQGRPAGEVIDELEALFSGHYERHRAGRGD